MIDCQTCRSHLDELEQGSLDDELAAKVRLHLDGCEFCRGWLQRTLNDRQSGPGGKGHGHNTGLDSISMWYERFERQRETRLSRRRLRLIQMSLVLAAFLLMVMGIRMRGERMNAVIAPRPERQVPIEPAAVLTRELSLTPDVAGRFFPLLHAYQNRVDSLETLRVRALADLEQLSGDTSPHNARVPELNARVEALQAERARFRSDFLSRVGSELGHGKESRLRQLQDVWDTGVGR